MEIENIGTITYRDAAEDQQACIVLRRADGLLLLCVSMEDGGNVETAMPRAEAEELSRMLQDALGKPS